MMKRSFKSILGVTLLEIMLVLAIAALVIVMSIRYYQSASLNQKITAAMSNITGVVAASESFLGAAGTFVGMTSSSITAYLPGNKMPSSPWGGAMTVAAGTSANTYTITIPNVPAATAGCTQLANYIKQNSKLTPGACPTTTAGGSLVVTVTE